MSQQGRHPSDSERGARAHHTHGNRIETLGRDWFVLCTPYYVTSSSTLHTSDVPSPREIREYRERRKGTLKNNAAHPVTPAKAAWTTAHRGFFLVAGRRVEGLVGEHKVGLMNP